MIRGAVAAALALALMQALAAARLELTFDEAYYAMWARWPQAGYLDHPPMVAWTIAASEALFGRSEFGVRALFWGEGALLAPLVGWIGWRLYDAETAAAAVLILVAAPLMAGAPLATPDTPLTFFWTLALAGLVEVWRGNRAWPLVGVAAGAAALAKMTAGFLALGIALALVAAPSLRREWRRPGPWLAAALAAAVASPFLIWNVTHGYATFAKQGGRLNATRFAPRYLGEFVGVQIALFNPLTVASALWALWRRDEVGDGAIPRPEARAQRASKDDVGVTAPCVNRADFWDIRRGSLRSRLRMRSGIAEPAWLLLATLAPALAYFTLHALHDRVQGNWLAPLYPTLALLAARVVPRWAPPAAAALGLVAVAAAYLHLATGAPAFGPADPALRIGGWRDLAAQVSARHPRYVLAQGYAATSLLAFYGSAPVVQLGEPERWTFRPPVDTSGEGLAFGRPDMAETLARTYPHVTPLATLRRRVGGVELEAYTLFAVGP